MTYLLIRAQRIHDFWADAYIRKLKKKNISVDIHWFLCNDHSDVVLKHLWQRCVTDGGICYSSTINFTTKRKPWRNDVLICLYVLAEADDSFSFIGWSINCLSSDVHTRTKAKKANVVTVLNTIQHPWSDWNMTAAGQTHVTLSKTLIWSPAHNFFPSAYSMTTHWSPRDFMCEEEYKSNTLGSFGWSICCFQPHRLWGSPAFLCFTPE